MTWILLSEALDIFGMFDRLVQGVRRVRHSVRNAWLGFFAPERLRRERLLGGIKESREAMQRSFEQHGFHVADVGRNGNLRVVRRPNGDRIVFFAKNLESDERLEHFFPENWQRFGTRFDSTRAVGQVMVKGGTGRSYMIKTISPFRPPIRRPGDENKGNTAFTEARILLDLHEQGFLPEVPVAVIMRPGYLPALVTRFIKGADTATWQEAVELQKRLKDRGYVPHDLFRLEEQRLMAHASMPPKVNAVTTRDDKKTHPVDVEFYDVPGVVTQTRRKMRPGDYPTRELISKQEKLRRMAGREVFTPLSKYDYRLRRWKPGTPENPFQVEWRAFVPRKKTKRGWHPEKWVPVEEAPKAPWRRFVVFDPVEHRWVLPEKVNVRVLNSTARVEGRPAFDMADSRFHAFVAVDPRTGAVHEAKSLVREIFDA